MGTFGRWLGRDGALGRRQAQLYPQQTKEQDGFCRTGEAKREETWGA